MGLVTDGLVRASLGGLGALIRWERGSCCSSEDGERRRLPGDGTSAVAVSACTSGSTLAAPSLCGSTEGG